MVTSHYGCCRGPGRSTHHTAMGILTTDGSHQAPLQELSSAEESCPALDDTPLEKCRYSGIHCYEDLQHLQSALQCLPVASLAIVLQLHGSLHPSLVPLLPSRCPSRSIFPNTPPAYKFTPHSLFPRVHDLKHFSRVSSQHNSSVLLFKVRPFLLLIFPSMTSISSPSKDKSLAI